MRFETVLFDLDGTLIDSGAIILASFRHAARTVLRREIEAEQVLVGGPTLLGLMRALDAERADELVRVYRAHNEPLHAELQPCAGVVGVLERLREEGCRLGVVTAKRHATVRLAFEVLPLAPYFDVVVAAEDTERQKPHPEPLLLALRLLGAEPARAAYVGDAPTDVEAARGADVHAIGVTWGRLHSGEQLETAGPDALANDAEELLAALA